MRPMSVAMLISTASQTGEKRVRRQSANPQRNELGFGSLSTRNRAALCCKLAGQARNKRSSTWVSASYNSEISDYAS